MTINPTTAAIETAVRNAAKMSEQGYTAKQSQGVPETWFAIKPDGKAWYLVNTLRGTCDCPQFQNEGVCKHQKFIADEISLLEAEQAHEDYRDMLAARD
jgi:hypothetical protein